MDPASPASDESWQPRLEHAYLRIKELTWQNATLRTQLTCPTASDAQTSHYVKDTVHNANTLVSSHELVFDPGEHLFDTGCVSDVPDPHRAGCCGNKQVTYRMGYQDDVPCDEPARWAGASPTPIPRRESMWAFACEEHKQLLGHLRRYGSLPEHEREMARRRAGQWVWHAD